MAEGITDLREGAIALGELDQTAGIDAVLIGRDAASSRRTAFFAGSGTSFTAITDPAQDGIVDLRLGDVVLADMDEDGNLDVLLSGERVTPSSAPVTTILINETDDGATPDFVQTSASPFHNLQQGALAVAELNGQPGLELINTGRNSSTSGPYTYYYENFDATNDNGWAPATSPFKATRFGSTSLADVDGDGDTDVLIVSDTADGYESILYLNDGSGGYTDANAGLAGASGYSAFGDVDNDGDPDLVIVGADTSGDPSATLYINDGSGGFSDAGAGLTGISAGWPSAVLFFDVDGDTDLDLLIAGNNGNNPSTTLYIDFLID